MSDTLPRLASAAAVAGGVLLVSASLVLVPVGLLWEPGGWGMMGGTGMTWMMDGNWWLAAVVAGAAGGGLALLGARAMQRPGGLARGGILAIAGGIVGFPAMAGFMFGSLLAILGGSLAFAAAPPSVRSRAV